MKISSLFLPVAILFTSTVFSQVKIGDTTGTINPRAVLELKDTTRGLLLPRMTTTQMNAITSPPNGLLIFNNSQSEIYRYRSDNNKWMPLRSDSSDWYLDTASKKLYLRQGLANNDSIYYNTLSKKFIFADTKIYTGSTGSSFELDEGNSDKFVFKTTASKFPRPLANLNSANVDALYEADNDTIAVNHPYEASYTGIAAVAVTTPSATQKVGSLAGLSSGVAHGGSDSLQAMYGIFNSAFQRGAGIDAIYGILNNPGIGSTATANFGTMYGINTTISYPAGGTTRGLGALYGIYVSQSVNMANRVDGPAYGLHIRNVTASSFSNWAVYTNKGANRFGDSTTITDGLGIPRPRMVLDVNSTSAMIIPTGSTSQRPSANYPGQLRFNTDNASPEAYTGSTWVSLKTPVIAATVGLNIATAAAGTSSLTVAVAGAALGNTVTISPDIALPAGLVIAWARVPAAGQVEVAFSNFKNTAVPSSIVNFYVKIIQ